MPGMAREVPAQQFAQAKKQPRNGRQTPPPCHRRMKCNYVRMTMFMAVLTVEFSLHGNDNLKAKRRIANSLKQKVRNKFNVSIAEVGSEDDMGRLALVIASVSNDARHLESRLTKCLSMMEAVCPEEMVFSDMECIGVD